jgi:hypothetical protein
MSAHELAVWLTVSRRFIETQIDKGFLRVRKIRPRCIRILPQDIEAWLNRTATTQIMLNDEMPTQLVHN